MFPIVVISLVTIFTAMLSLTGGFLLLSKSKITELVQKYGTIMAAVVLLYAVFGDIIPEIMEQESLPPVLMVSIILFGCAICFVVNRLAGHMHKHGDTHALKSKQQAYSMLVVDSIHTILDGIVIGTSFATSLGTGIIAATATAAHEVPQEIGDFAIMIRSKIPVRKIVKLQLLSALILVPAAVVSYLIGDVLADFLPVALSFIAGFLLYIAIGEICSIIRVIWHRRLRADA